MLTRREFGTLTLAGSRSGLKPRATVEPRRFDAVNGVRLGVQTYSFRDLPRPAGRRRGRRRHQGDDRRAASASASCARRSSSRSSRRRARRRGAPPSPEAVKAREDLRKWRLETPLDHFRDVKKKFDAAGITIYAYNYSLNDELHRRRDRSRLRDGQGARRRDHHASTHARRREADRAVRRQAQMIVGHARPLEHQRPERVRHARELRRGDEDVEVLQGQPRHRPLHRRQLRRRSPTSASTTPTSPTCTSRIARRTRATTCRGARATRRSARCCSC